MFWYLMKHSYLLYTVNAYWCAPLYDIAYETFKTFPFLCQNTSNIVIFLYKFSAGSVSVSRVSSEGDESSFKMAVFWVIMLYCLLDSYWHFGGACWPHLLLWSWRVAGFSETFVSDANQDCIFFFVEMSVWSVCTALFSYVMATI
jgi:hypothetical protein